MEGRDGDRSRRRVDQFYPSKKKRLSNLLSPKSAKSSKTSENSPNRRTSFEDSSPHKKGTLEGFIVSSKSPISSGTSTVGVEERHARLDVGCSIRTSLCNRIEESGGGFCLKKCSTLSSKQDEPTGKCEEKNHLDKGFNTQGNPITASECSNLSLLQDDKLNLQLSQFANDFLSICVSGISSAKNVSAPQAPSEDDSHGKKRDVGSMDFVPAEPHPKKHHVDLIDAKMGHLEGDTRRVSEEELPKGQNAVETSSDIQHEVTGGYDTPLKEDTDRMRHVSDKTPCGNFITPEGVNQSLIARRSKPPCTPHTSSDQKAGRPTPSVWLNQNKFCSPGDAFWDEAIEVTNGLLACRTDHSAALNLLHPNDHQMKPEIVEDESAAEHRSNNLPLSTHACVLKASNVASMEIHQRGGTSERSAKVSSPLPIRHFDFTSQGTSETQGEVEKDVVNVQSGDVRELAAGTVKVQECNREGVIIPNPEGTELCDWLPMELCQTYAKKGLSRLYQWQLECLRIDGVWEGKSLVYSASTSAGKSLVAEILMLKTILGTGKKAMLVLPYVALCSEKAEHLESLLEPVGKRVGCFFGTQGSATLPPDTSVAVCTIEKANSLTNKLIEEGRLSELAVVVIDELHMVGDMERGYLLELMLTKLRYAAGKGESCNSTPEKADAGSSLQIIGMSATMPNVAAVAAWLQAAFYHTDFRPVPLDEYIKVGKVIYNTNMETVRILREDAELGRKDPEHVVELCHEVVREGHSALLFCSSRRACETSARHVAKFLPKFSTSCKGNAAGYKDGYEAVKELEKCPAGLDPVLAETLPAGVAYHHAGLTAEERDVVEACYRQGIVRVLAATSTLAAGVNLPARRVIFRQPKVGRDFLDGTRYRQMAGRAGRAGIDTKGESIMICKPEEVNRMLPILKEGCKPLQSCLAEDKNGMTRALLEVVAGGIVQSAQDVNRYVRCTLLNSTQPFEDVVKSAQDSLRWLCHKRLIEWDHELEMYKTTPLGKAAFGSSLSPEESLVVLEDLAKAREGFVLASDLHIVYEVTPIHVELEPDWGVYYQRFVELSHVEQAVANRVGVMEAFLMRMAHGAPVQPRHRMAKSTRSPIFQSGKTGEQLPMDQILRVCRRFYVAMILSKLVQEVPLMDVCSTFKVPRGTVQALQDSSGRFAAMVATFCERLGWHDLEVLISKFQNRVSFGVRAEIVGLTEIPFVKAARARALYTAGLRTVQAVAEATIPELINALYHISSKGLPDGSGQASHWVHAAAARKINNGARKIVLVRAEEARKAAFSAFQALGVTVPQSLSQPLYAKIQECEPETVEASGATKQTSKNSENVVGDRDEHNKENEYGLSAPLKASEPCANVHAMSGAFGGSVINEVVNLQPVRSFRRCEELDKGPLDVDKIQGGFEAFMEMWQAVQEFSFDLHFQHEAEGVLFEIEGVAVCWQDSPVFYVGSMETNLRWSKICSIFGKKGVKKICWDLKRKVQVLKNPGFSSGQEVASLFQKSGRKQNPLIPMTLEDLCIDVRVLAWLLWPDEESNPTTRLEELVKKRLPGEIAGAASRAGRWANQMGRIAESGCCRRAAQVRGLHSVLWKLILSEGLYDPLLQLELPLVRVIADMESWAIGVNMKACQNARQLLETKIKQLESKAQILAGMNFSLALPADVADVLYRHLKLPVPPGAKGKQHPSTDKQALDLLRDKHPVVSIIKEHRSLSKLLHTTIGAVVTFAKKSPLNSTSSGAEQSSHYISGQWLHTSTGTGRLSMENPNLQCVEHSICFSLEDTSTSEVKQVEVNAREFFVPTEEGWILMSADYSQIELRLMAHFSGDDALVALLSKPTGDLFRMIAAQWTGQDETDVSDKQREQTKRMVYGILYGMGINTLAERLECSVGEASNYHERFKAAFPGVTAWLQQAVHSCRQNGYVKTLGGRKRYLEKINNSKRSDQAKAERQAVNSICQGSAADLIKMAMIDLHSALTGSSSKTLLCKGADGSSQNIHFGMLHGRCRLLLQIHDELLLEVEKSVVREASMIIRTCMEGAASLKVPLNVKLQVGPSWGQLHPFK